VAIDLAAVALLVLAAAFGSGSGALHQLVHLGGMLVGWLAAWHLGAPIARGLARWFPQTAARGAAGVLLFLGFSILAAWIGHRFLAAKRLADRAHAHDSPRPTPEGAKVPRPSGLSACRSASETERSSATNNDRFRSFAGFSGANAFGLIGTGMRPLTDRPV